MTRDFLFDLFGSIANTKGAIAGAAAVSPVWIDKAQGALMTFSDFASALLPIFGVGWLLLQMFYATVEHIRKSKGDK